MSDSCHCGLNTTFLECCGAILCGVRPALTAEALMRSRYTAYVLGDAEYLLRSWHPATRPAVIDLDTEQRWLGLRIKSTEQGGLTDSTGVVAFVARYKIGGKGYRLEETSRFRKSEDRWVYFDADTE